MQSPSLTQFLWRTSVDPLLTLDKEGIILDSNLSAQSEYHLRPGEKLLDFVVEKDEFLVMIRQVETDSGSKFHEPTFFHLSRKNTGKIRFQISPAADADHPAVRYAVNVPRRIHALESLQEAARSNDQRIENLREDVTAVTKELLEKTLQLAEQKNKVAAIIEAMGEGLIGCDSQGRIMHINQAARRLLLPMENEAIGLPFETLFPDIAQTIGFKNHSFLAIEKKLVDLSYEGKELRISASPIVDSETHSNAGFVLIIQDRTEQAELDRLKSDLISIVSHELRSPLTSIKGYIDLMLSGELGDIPEEILGYLAIVSTNTNRLASLIDDMLDLSRIETGKLNMSFGKVEIKYLCDFVYLTMKPQADQKKIEFHVETKEGLLASGDQDRLQQALTNLVSNAIKYTPEGGKTSIRAEKRDEWIVIDVIDTGMGISAENQKKLFQRFFRVKNKATRNIGGTGLGLCITKSIIEAHDGHLSIQSEEGKGSSFTIELPSYQS
ncbi:MAG: PAS domain-containing protein [Candidatus Omnitrophica bacterium]|nr:PAS domain-containing protein [Candidatus Omnitrophota bacterium]